MRGEGQKRAEEDTVPGLSGERWANLSGPRLALAGGKGVAMIPREGRPDPGHLARAGLGQRPRAR